MRALPPVNPHRMPSGPSRRHPLVWLAVAAIAGVLLGRAGVAPLSGMWVAGGGLLLVLFGAAWSRVSRGKRPPVAVTLGILVAVTGGFLAWYASRDATLQIQQNRFPERTKAPVILHGVVVEPAAPLHQVPDPTAPQETLTGDHTPAPPLLSGTWDGGEGSIRSPMRTAFVVRAHRYEGGEQPFDLAREPGGEELVRVYTDELWPDIRYGDQIEIPVTLVTPRGATNPGEFDFRNWLRERGIVRIGLWHYSNGMRRHADAGLAALTPRAIALDLRQRIIRFVHTHLEEPHASLLLTISLGLRATLSGNLTEAFRRTGTVHLLVISGLHVGLLLVVIELCLTLFRVPHRPRVIIVIVALLFFRELTGGQVAVTRAVCFTSLWYASSLLSRRPSFINLLAGTAFIVLLLNPHDLFNAGFQLSFTAVLALHWIVVLERRAIAHHGLPRPLAQRLFDGVNGGIATSLAVLIGLLPLLWHWFGIAPVSSLVVNLPAVPLMALVVALALPLMVGVAVLAVLPFLSPVLEPVLAFIAQVAASLQFALVQIVGFAGNQPWSHLELPPLRTSQMLVLMVLIVAWVNRRTLRLPDRRVLLVGGMTCGVLAVAGLDAAPTEKPPADAIVLDIGQGSCVLLRTPAGQSILVDPGEIWRGDVARDIILPALRHYGVRTLDAIVLTNPDWSHTSALADVLDTVRTRQVLVGAAFTHDLAAEVRLAPVRFRGIPLSELHPGDVVNFGDARLIAIGPLPEAIEQSRNPMDDRSLSLLWQPYPDAGGGTALVLPGDIRVTGLDAQIVQATTGHWPGGVPAAAVLLPNFGRPESITDEWLAAWQARAAIAPDGAPPSDRLMALETPRCRVLPTFRYGAVRIRTTADGTHTFSRWASGDWRDLPER